MSEEIIHIRANIDDLDRKLADVEARLNKLHGTADATGQSIADAGKKGSTAMDGAGRSADRATKETNELGDSAKRTSIALDETGKKGADAGRRVEQGAKSGGKGLDQMRSKANSLSSTMTRLGGIIGVAFGVREMLRFIDTAADLGEKIGNVRVAFERLGTVDLQSLRAATGGMVSDLQLMQTAVKASNLGVPVENLGRLLEFASVRAAETGENVDYLVESIVNGIGRKSILILDNLGISSTRLREELGDVSLATAEVGDVAAAVARIIDQEMVQSIDDVADSTARLSTAWQNFAATVGEGVVGRTWREAKLELAEMLNIWSGVETRQEILGKRVVSNWKAAGRSIDEIKRDLEEFDPSWLEMVGHTIQTEMNRIPKLLGFRAAFGESNIAQAQAAREYVAKLEEAEKAAADLAKQEERRSRANTVIDELMAAQIEHLKSLGLYKEEEQEEERGLIEMQREKVKRLNDMIEAAKTEDELRALRIERERELLELKRLEELANGKTERVEVARLKRQVDLNKLLGIELGILSRRERLRRAEKDLEILQDPDVRVDIPFMAGREEIRMAEIEKEMEEHEKAVMKPRKDTHQEILQMIRDEVDAVEAAEQAKQDLMNATFNLAKTLGKDNAAMAKALGVFQATINAYLAIQNTLSSVPYPANLIAAAAIGVQAFANVAQIMSTPEPTGFFFGTEYAKLNGNPSGRDTIPAMINEGEAVIPTKRNAERPGLAKAWIDGTLDNHITVNYVLPKLRKLNMERELEAQLAMRNIFQGSVSAKLSDDRIVEGLRQNAWALDGIAETLRSKRSNPYRA